MYRWDIEEIKKELKKTQRLMNQEKDLDRKKEFQYAVYSYQELLEYYEMVIKGNEKRKSTIFYREEKNLDFSDVLYDDLSTIRTYGGYASIIRDFVEKFKWEELRREENYKRVGNSCESIILLANNFFSKTGAFFSEYYRQLASDFSTRLEFISIDRNIDCSGFTHPIYGTDRIYIDVGINHSIQDYVSIIHEVSHGITSKANRNIMWDDCKYCFLEVDSLFWEMVGTDYIGEKLQLEEDALKLKQATFIDYLYNADLVCSKLDLYNSTSNPNLLTKRNAKIFLKSEAGYKFETIQDTCNTYIRSYWQYLISYLTAIELYLIYLEDKDYALGLLQKIVMLSNLGINDYLKTVRELGINPGKNVGVYYNMIAPNGGFNYVKKI